jgi:hypothetical protein
MSRGDRGRLLADPALWYRPALIVLGFDPVEAANLLLERLDRIVAALERIADALEAELEQVREEEEVPHPGHS